MAKLMLGNEAVARGAYEAGCSVVVAYPGTPSTEITEYAAGYDEIYCEWSPNEKVAAEVAVGASIAGARAVCCMKHVGLNVAADPVFTARYTGVNGGLVMVVADDPGMHSSQNEQDTRLVARAALVPVMEPSDSRECKEFVKRAFEISEMFDTPVIVRLTTRIAHARSIVEIEDKIDYRIKDYVKDYRKYVMMPGMARVRHTVVEKSMADLAEFAESSDLNVVEWGGTRSIGVVTSGISYQYAKEAFGDNASYLKLGMVYPIAKNLIRDFASKVDVLYVVEELEPFIETEIRAMGICVTGKDKLTLQGEYSVGLLKKNLLGICENETEAFKTPNRPPVMCPGCPHRATYYVLKKLKLQVAGDIGCYTLGALSPIESMDTCICMGASIGVAHGFEKARGADFAKKTVAILGDSTFIHSGITGLIDVVYNKGMSTVIILDNSITGMTGHQQNPTTGLTIKNEPTVKIDLVKLCQGVGIESVKVVDPFDLKLMEQTVREEINSEKPSVIIAQSPCVLLKSVPQKSALSINNDKCKNCKACLKVGCPCISNITGKPEIDGTQCKGCELCTSVCSFGAISKRGDSDE